MSFTDQDYLNAAAGGNFLEKHPNDCLRIIESRAKVRHTRNIDFSRISTESHSHSLSPSPNDSISRFEFEQMKANLEDHVKVTITNQVNDVKNMLQKIIPSTTQVKEIEQNNEPVFHDIFLEYQQTAALAN